MKKIAIVVGIHTDAIDEESYPEWLQDIPNTLQKYSRERWGPGYYGLGSDIGVAYYVWKRSQTTPFQVDILRKQDIHLKKFNEYDYIIGLYEPYYLAIETEDSKEYKRYCSLIQKTSATFLQPLSLQKFVLNKQLYLTIMKQHGIPTMDFFGIAIRNTINETNLIKRIQRECDKWNTNTFITKPQPGGFGTGFRKWKLKDLLKNPKTLSTYLKQIQSQVKIEKPVLLFQKFVPEFEIQYEVRTYWILGKYSHSLGTMIHPDSLGTSGFEKVKYAYPPNEYPYDYLDSYDEEPGFLDASLITKLKKMGKQVIQHLPKDPTGIPFLIRIDFGCCLDNQKVCRDYFLK